MAPARNSSSSKCRQRKRRLFVSCRFWMNRKAGNSSSVGLRRMIKCSTIGNTTKADPARSERLTKVIFCGQPRIGVPSPFEECKLQNANCKL